MMEKQGQKPDRRLEFWFDFASGYAYFAAQEIEALGQRIGCEVVWRPFMLGAAFKATGARGLSKTPLKGDYARHDWARLARLMSIPFAPPANHPVVALAATRATYWVEEHMPDQAGAFALAAINGYYHGELDVSSPDKVAALGAKFEIDVATLRSGIDDPSIKEIARLHCDDAIARGVFGSPFFLLGDEPFWGWDRMPMIERWVSEGGW